MSSDYEYDIAYLTAKPLMRQKNGRPSVAGEIDVMEYVIRMRSILEDSKKQCRFFHDYATRPNLNQTCAISGAKVLHVTLHGSENGQRELLIEHDRHIGNPESLSTDDVMKAFGDKPPLVAVVLSKHAEKLIQFFERCGVPHVVGMRYEYQSKDPPILEFKKQFYTYLLSGYSVKQAFENAYKDTSQKLGVTRWSPSKFLLAGTNHAHDDIIFPKLQNGKYKDCTKKHGNYKLPMPVQNFVGRNHSIFELLTNIMRNDEPKLTWVYGTQGFGKTGLVTMAAHYLKERKNINNILYVDVASSPEKDLPVIVGQSLRQKANAQEDLYAEMGELMHMLQYHEYHQDTTNNSSFITNSNKKITNIRSLAEAFSSLDDEVLLILDSVLKNGNTFRECLTFCSKILKSCQNVRLLCVSRVFNRQSLQNQVRERRLPHSFLNIRTYDMKPMAEFAALRLLLHTRQPQALHNEFGNINTKEREQIVANHPCGSLAIKYHVPLAVKRIAQIMDRSNLYFCTVSIEVLELIIKDLVPFHVYLHRESANYHGDHQILRNNGLAPCNQLPPFALDLLNHMQLRLNSYQRKHAPHIINNSFMNPSMSRGHMGWGGPQGSLNRINSRQDGWGPTPGMSMGGASPMTGMRSYPSPYPSQHFSSMNSIQSPSVHLPQMGSMRTVPSADNGPKMSGWDINDPESSSEDSDDESTSKASTSGASQTFAQQPSQSDSGAEATPLNPQDWNSEEVAEWLGNLGSAYEKYKIVITENGIDGSCMKEVLTDYDMLKELGISSLLNRKVIAKKTSQLFADFES